jgi:hypothetical protein
VNTGTPAVAWPPGRRFASFVIGVPMSLSSDDIITALQPELDQLVIAAKVEPDERAAFASAALALFAKCQAMEREHGLDWLPDVTLRVVQCVCAVRGMIEHAAAVGAIRDYHRQYHARVRYEQAKLN